VSWRRRYRGGVVAASLSAQDLADVGQVRKARTTGSEHVLQRREFVDADEPGFVHALLILYVVTKLSRSLPTERHKICETAGEPVGAPCS
jgi:hypothetical protein